MPEIYAETNGLERQLLELGIQSLPFSLSQISELSPYGSITKSAAGALFAVANRTEGGFSTVEEEVWSDGSTPEMLAGTARAYSAAFEFVGVSDPLVRANLLSQLSPDRLDRLQRGDRLELLASIAKSGPKRAKELDYSFDPFDYVDYFMVHCLRVGGQDEAFSNNVFGDIVAARDYYQDPRLVDQVVDRIANYYVNDGSIFRRTFGSLVRELDEGKIDQEGSAEAAYILPIKLGEFFLTAMLDSLAELPEQVETFASRLIDAGYRSNELLNFVEDNISSGAPHFLRLYDRLKKGKSDAILHQNACLGFARSGNAVRVLQIIASTGILDVQHMDDGLRPSPEDNCYGSILAKVVSAFRDHNDEGTASYLEQRILMKPRLAGSYTFEKAKIVVSKKFASGDIVGAVRAAVDGRVSLGYFRGYSSLTDEAVMNGHGFELVDALMGEYSEGEPIHIIQNKKSALESVLVSLEHANDKGILLDDEIATVKQRVLQSVRTLIEEHKQISPEFDAPDLVGLLARAGDVEEAMAMYRAFSHGSSYWVRPALREIIIAKARSGTKDDLQVAYELYMDRMSGIAAGPRLEGSLIAAALMQGNEQMLSSLADAIPDYKWVGKLIIASQGVSHKSPELSIETFTELTRNRSMPGLTHTLEKLAGLTIRSFRPEHFITTYDV